MGNETGLLALALVALLLFGCTINPQDSVAGGQNQTSAIGAQGSSAGTGAGDNTSMQGTNQTQVTGFTPEEVAAHSSKGDCWMVIGGKVLDLSGYTTHPGGDTFVPYCGKDGTEGFATMGDKGIDHSPDAYLQIETYVIGRVG